MVKLKIIFKELKIRAGHLKKELTALFYALQSPETGILPRLLILLTLAYALSPIDLIPDVIPVLGYLDDILILPGLIALSIKLIPPETLDSSREKAAKEPISLKKRWYLALPILAIWLFIATRLLTVFVSH